MIGKKVKSARNVDLKNKTLHLWVSITESVFEKAVSR